MTFQAKESVYEPPLSSQLLLFCTQVDCQRDGGSQLLEYTDLVGTCKISTLSLADNADSSIPFDAVASSVSVVTLLSISTSAAVKADVAI